MPITRSFAPQMPKNVFEEWPAWLSRWFGYRASTAAPPSKTNYVVWIWSFIGAFGGLSVLQAIFTYSEYFLQRKVPPIIASYVSTFTLRRVTSSPKCLHTVSRVLPPCWCMERSNHRWLNRGHFSAVISSRR